MTGKKRHLALTPGQLAATGIDVDRLRALGYNPDDCTVDVDAVTLADLRALSAGDEDWLRRAIAARSQEAT